jgi:hypothetical protein
MQTIDEREDRQRQRDRQRESDELKRNPATRRSFFNRVPSLYQSGKGFSGRCPFHRDTNPSFKVDVKNGEFVWHCFPCHKGGDVFNFVMEADECDFPAAVKKVSEECGESAASKPSTSEPLKTSAIKYDKAASILRLPEALPYLKANGVSEKVALAHDVGVSEYPGLGKSIDFPYDGKNVKVRALDRSDFRHYPGTSTSALLYNVSTVDDLDVIDPKLIITESERDCLTLESHGLNAISVSSASACLNRDGSLKFSPEDLEKLLQVKTIYLALDQDEPGQKCAAALKLALPHAKNLTWPYGVVGGAKDVGEIFASDPSNFNMRITELCREAEARPESPIVATVGEDETDEAVPEEVPMCPPEAMAGGYIGELVELLSRGTTIAPEFLLLNVLMILGALVDGKIGFAGHQDLHTRFYAVNISDKPRSGKGVSWSRTGEEPTGVLSNLLAERGVRVMDGSLFGSGEFMVGVLSEWAQQVQKESQNARVDVIIRCDEMAETFEKAKALGSTLTHKILQLFERSSISTGSFKNKEFLVHDLHLSISGDFTMASFEKAFAGQGARGSGLLSRFTYVYAKRPPHKDRWPEMDGIGLLKVLTKIKECLERVDDRPEASEPGELFELRTQPRLIPRETEGATRMIEEFLRELDNPDDAFTPELPTHFKRYILLQTIFSDNQVIDEAKTAQAILWTRYQPAVRRALWPEDGGNLVEQFEQKILKSLEGRQLSLAKLMDWCNVNRPGSGGRDVFLRALKALTASGDILAIGRTQRGSAIYALR